MNPVRLRCHYRQQERGWAIEPSLMVPGCASHAGTRVARMQGAHSAVARTLVDPSTVVTKEFSVSERPVDCTTEPMLQMECIVHE